MCWEIPYPTSVVETFKLFLKFQVILWISYLMWLAQGSLCLTARKCFSWLTSYPFLYTCFLLIGWPLKWACIKTIRLSPLILLIKMTWLQKVSPSPHLQFSSNSTTQHGYYQQRSTNMHSLMDIDSDFYFYITVDNHTTDNIINVGEGGHTLLWASQYHHNQANANNPTK